MNQVYEKERQLHREVAEKVEGRLPGVEVLAVELRGPESLAVYLDRPGGVDHALCERVTDLLREYLDRYSLEVSSPGLDRPLKRLADYGRFVGERVSLKLREPLEGRRNFEGVLRSAVERGCELEFEGKDGPQVLSFVVDDVDKARLVPRTVF